MNAVAEGRFAMKAGRPRVLLYGAGVLGCLLRHALLQGGNGFYAGAHGSAWWTSGGWSYAIGDGCAPPRRACPPSYRLLQGINGDVVFVAVRFKQIANVLEALAKNCSRHVVFVGNNPAAGAARSALRALSNAPREVAFGFQNSGGRREKESVVGIYARLGMTVGAAHGEMRAEMRALLERLFAGARYRLHFQRDMDAYLKCHAALILPVACAVYRCGGDLRRCRKDDRRTVIRATLEGYAVLRARRTPILPPEDEKFYRDRPWAASAWLWFLCKTPLGRMAVSEHAMNAPEEMRAIGEAFAAIKARADAHTPAWDSLTPYLKQV